MLLWFTSVMNIDLKTTQHLHLNTSGSLTALTFLLTSKRNVLESVFSCVKWRLICVYLCLFMALWRENIVLVTVKV